MEVFKVLSQDWIQQLCTLSRPLTFQFQGRAGGVRGGLQGFAGQSSSTASSSLLMALGKGFFRTFPRKKKSAKQGPHSGSELGADFTSSTLSAHQMPLDEQLVDVPVPQVHEESSCERETRLIGERLARLVSVEEEQMHEEEEGGGRGGGLAVSSSLPSSPVLLVRACRQHLSSWLGLHLCTS